MSKSKQLIRTQKGTTALNGDHREQLAKLEHDLSIMANIGQTLLVSVTIVGLRIVFLKEALPHGELKKSIESPRFAKYGTYNTLFRYSQAARAFMNHLKMKTGADDDKVTAKNWTRLSPLLRGDMKDGIWKKLKGWADHKSLADACLEFFGKERALPPSPTTTANETQTSASGETQLDLFLDSWTGFKRNLESELFIKAPPKKMLEMHGTMKAALESLEKQLRFYKML